MNNIVTLVHVTIGNQARLAARKCDDVTSSCISHTAQVRQLGIYLSSTTLSYQMKVQ